MLLRAGQSGPRMIVRAREKVNTLERLGSGKTAAEAEPTEPAPSNGGAAFLDPLTTRKTDYF
ncbi:MAG: hypothetical protein NVS3B20_14950 [Polyangiales bacterium]